MFRYVVAGYDDFRNGGAFETENKFNIMQIVNQYFVKFFLQPHFHSAPIFVHYRIGSTSIIYLLSDKENEIL